MSSELPILPNIKELVSNIRSGEGDTKLGDAVDVLYEHSPVLREDVLPALIAEIRNDEEPPTNYAELTDLVAKSLRSFDKRIQAQFIAAHPRIGEVTGLSALSAAEQSAKATPPEVLQRLEFLNACLERRYPGLRYITFVNGRSRAQIRDELERKLFEEGVLPLADEKGVDSIQGHSTEGEKWENELARAVDDVRKIAHSRLSKLGVE